MKEISIKILSILFLVSLIKCNLGFLENKEEELKTLLSEKIDFKSFSSYFNQRKLKKEIGTTYVEKIIQAGYQFEEHKILTEDGYINTAWRIPRKQKEEKNLKRKPIILQHGLIDDSYTFLALQTKNALPFLLAEIGYDVWLPNSRGNMFSCEHIDPEKDSAKFYSDYWNFSFAEMSKYDFPATINYIKSVTDYEKIDYIGHSQGTFIYYLSFLTNPDLINSSIDKFVSIGTIVTIYNSDSRAMKIAEFLKIFDLLDLLRLRNVLELGTNFGGLVHFLCDKFTFVCKELIGNIIGTKITNRVDWHDIDGLYFYEPGGTSTKNLIHWIQINSRQELGLFDYGQSENLKLYGTPTPPKYELNNFKDYKIKSLITISDSDPFSNEKDIHLLLDKIPKENHHLLTIKRLTNYNHLDYLWAECAKTDLYEDIISFLQQE